MRPYGALARQALRPTPLALSRHAVGVSARRCVSQESQLHHPDRANEAEAKKQEQLQEQKDGKGQWKAELASDSEHAIKADRESPAASKEDMENLQKQTQDHVQKKHGQK